MPFSEQSSFFRHALLSAVVFVVLVAVTIGLWRFTIESMHRQAHVNFSVKSKNIEQILMRRLAVYRSALHGIGGLFAASETVSRQEFQAFAKQMNLPENYTGLSSIAYAARVPGAEVENFAIGLKSEFGEALSSPAAVYPRTSQAEYFPLTYIEPLSGSERAIGFDLGSEASRRQALERARDTGKASATRVFRGAASGAPSFSIYLPVYMHGAPVTTVEERRAAFTGLVIANFRVDTFFEDFKSESGIDPSMNFEVHDTSVGTNVDPTHVLYDNSDSANFDTAELRLENKVDMAGQNWWLRFGSHPETELSEVEHRFPWFILIGGLIFSLLAAGILYRLITSRARALAQANKMTAAFRDSERMFRLSMENAGDMFYIHDLEGRFVDVNRRACDELGYTRNELLGMSAVNIDPAWSKQDLKKQLKTMALGIPMTRESTETRKDKTSFPVEVKMTLFESGGRRLILAVARDITERKQNEEKLSQRNQELERLNRLMVNREMRMIELKRKLADISGSGTNKTV